MKFSTMVLAAALLGAIALPQARASEMDKKTFLTFHRSIEIPGMILPPGDYVMKRADRSLPDVITFTNRRENHVFATVFAMPTYRDVPTGDVVIITEERPANQPEALKKWFYPGDIVGAEFKYPKHRPVLMAMNTSSAFTERSSSFSSMTSSEPSRPVAEPLVEREAEPLPAAEPTPVADRHEDLQEEPVLLAQNTPQQDPATAQAPAATSPNTDTDNNQLPQTAGNFAAWGLLGMLSVIGGLLLRKFASQL
jgi:hypothetical protein